MFTTIPLVIYDYLKSTCSIKSEKCPSFGKNPDGHVIFCYSFNTKKISTNKVLFNNHKKSWGKEVKGLGNRAGVSSGLMLVLIRLFGSPCW